MDGTVLIPPLKSERDYLKTGAMKRYSQEEGSQGDRGGFLLSSDLCTTGEKNGFLVAFC